MGRVSSWSSRVLPSHGTTQSCSLRNALAVVSLATAVSASARSSTLGVADGGGRTRFPQWSYNPFVGLPQLPKVHHSDQVIDQGIDRNDPAIVDYARITRALPLSIDRSSANQNDFEELAGELREIAAICAAPIVNCSVSLLYSPWEKSWGYDGAAVRGAQEQAELQFFAARLLNVSRLLGNENQRLHASVRVGAIVLDSETFQMFDDNISGIHSGSAKERAEVTRKHDLIYNLTQQFFPGVSVPMYGRGQMRRAYGASKAVTGASVTPDQGWVRGELYTLAERGDSYGPILYSVNELALMRENYNRVVANARAHNVSKVVPWIALGAGSPRVVSAAAGFGEFSWAFDYPRVFSWMLGREVHDPYFAQYPDLYAAWDFATEVVLYPLPWDPRGKSVGPTNGDTALVRHFIAYVLGAAGVLALPADPVTSTAPTISVPSDGDSGFCGASCDASNWLLGGGANWGGPPAAPSPSGTIIHSAVAEHYSCPSHNLSFATLTHPVQAVQTNSLIGLPRLHSLQFSYRYASVWCPESASAGEQAAPNISLVLSHELLGPTGVEVWNSGPLPITGVNGVTTLSEGRTVTVDVSQKDLVQRAAQQPIYIKFVFANVVGASSAEKSRGLLLQAPVNLTASWSAAAH